MDEWFLIGAFWTGVLLGFGWGYWDCARRQNKALRQTLRSVPDPDTTTVRRRRW